jgi:hypothetical protein
MLNNYKGNEGFSGVRASFPAGFQHPMLEKIPHENNGIVGSRRKRTES